VGVTPPKYKNSGGWTILREQGKRNKGTWEHALLIGKKEQGTWEHALLIVFLEQVPEHFEEVHF